MSSHTEKVRSTENAPGFDYGSFQRKSGCWLPLLFRAYG